MNYEDLLAALYAELESSVSAFAVDVEVRFPGVDYQTSVAEAWAYLSATIETVSDRTASPAAAGEWSVEMWRRNDPADAYAGAALAETIRAHFANRTLVVLGTASGSPSTTRGVVDVTSVRVDSLGAVEDAHVFQLGGSWHLRG